MAARVDTEATEAALSAVVARTEWRWPVFDLLRDAGVRPPIRWVRRAPA